MHQSKILFVFVLLTQNIGGCFLHPIPQAAETAPLPQIDNQYATFSELPVLHRLYAYEHPNKLFDPVRSPQSVGPALKHLAHGDWMDIVSYENTSSPNRCYGKVASGDFYKTRCKELTTYPYDPVVAKAQWGEIVSSYQGKLIDIPRYDVVVRGWPTYKGKNTILDLQNNRKRGVLSYTSSSINTSVPLLDKRNSKRNVVGLAWLHEDPTLGYYRIVSPFHEMNEARDWYEGKDLQFIMEFAELYEDRGPDKMPVLFAVAAFDGAQVFRYEPDRCVPLVEHLATRYESSDNWFWNCISKAMETPNQDLHSCRPASHIEAIWYKQAHERHLGCVNSFAWNKKAVAAYHTISENMHKCGRDRRASWLDFANSKQGTIRREEAQTEARQVREECSGVFRAAAESAKNFQW